MLDWLRGPRTPPTWHLTRFLFLRGLGAIYLVAFAVAWQQQDALWGPDGLRPASVFLDRLGDNAWRVPSLFQWIGASAASLHGVVGLGLVMSAVVLAGYANAPILAALWVLYLSVVNVGQDFTSYGWESQLLETGFLGIFLAPVLDGRPLRAGDPPPTAVIWLQRWLLVRIMLGAGLIKLRGDPCWTELTCLDWFYETQPVPNPLSWYWHHMPAGWLAGGVLVNHLVEIPLAVLVLGPRPVRTVAGVGQIAFQGLLVLGGNLAFLNWLTMLNAVCCLDDRLLRHVVPLRIPNDDAEPFGVTMPRKVTVGGLVLLVGFLSIEPTVNLLSPHQIMNTSFDPLRLVNTYGAFGSVGQVRTSVIIEGTDDDPSDPGATWKEYVLPCAPGPVDRRPCVLGPWHHRLDWQIWFAGFSSPQDEPWMLHLVWQLLHRDTPIRSLLAHDPFDGRPPRAIRVSLYEYRFTDPGEPGWWVRKRLGDWVPPLAVDDPRWPRILEMFGWD